MKSRLFILFLALIGLFYFLNQFEFGSIEKHPITGRPIVSLHYEFEHGIFNNRDADDRTHGKVELQALADVLHLAKLPRKEREERYREMVAAGTELGEFIKFIYNHGCLPDRSNAVSFFKVPFIYQYFSGRSEVDSFEQAHMRSALKHYDAPLNEMRDKYGIPQLTITGISETVKR